MASLVTRDDQPQNSYLWEQPPIWALCRAVPRATCRTVVRDCIAALFSGDFCDHILISHPRSTHLKVTAATTGLGTSKFIMEMINPASHLSPRDVHDYLGGDGSHARLLYIALSVCMPIASLFILIRIYTQLCVVGKFQLEDCRFVPNILFESY